MINQINKLNFNAIFTQRSHNSTRLNSHGLYLLQCVHPCTVSKSVQSECLTGTPLPADMNNIDPGIHVDVTLTSTNYQKSVANQIKPLHNSGVSWWQWLLSAGQYTLPYSKHCSGIVWRTWQRDQDVTLASRFPRCQSDWFPRSNTSDTWRPHLTTWTLFWQHDLQNISQEVLILWIISVYN